MIQHGVSAKMHRSLPARGAWIEIYLWVKTRETLLSRSPHGERGLKSTCTPVSNVAEEVAPRTGSVD